MWLASPWKYTSQQDSCRSKHYTLSVHHVTLHHSHSKTSHYQKISIVHTVSTRRLTIHPEAGKLQYYTLCVHQATYNTPQSSKISMLHTLRPPINLQYTPKQENLNTTHCVSTKWLTIVLIHPKAGKPQCYTQYVHPATYITLEEGVKQSLLGCVAFVGVHHQQMANLPTHKQLTQSVHTHKNS